MKKLGRVYARYALEREILAPYTPYPRRVIPNLPAGIKLKNNHHINKKKGKKTCQIGNIHSQDLIKTKLQ